MIGTVKAMDRDSGRNGLVRYEVRPGGAGAEAAASGLFGVDPTTGEIRLRAAKQGMLVEER